MKFGKRISSYFILNLGYIVFSIVYAIFLNGSNFKDFLLIYKIYIYLFFLTFLLNRQFLTEKIFFNFHKFYVGIFLLKYSIYVFRYGFSRPILFYENNFELMLLALSFYLYYIKKAKVSILHQVVIGIIFILSGSISGILILFFVLAIINQKYLLKKAIYLVPIFILFSFFAFEMIKSRTGGELDFTRNARYKFMLSFFYEVREWSILDFLVGKERITPLSQETCRSLRYWHSLFSYKKDGSCYSVILHSYILRAIYDHGVLGLLFIVFYIKKIIELSGYKTKNALVVLGIVLINGLSVSSFNSIYFVIGVLLFLSVKKPELTYN